MMMNNDNMMMMIEECDASLLFSVKWYEENPNYWPLISENQEDSPESCDQTPSHSVPFQVR